MCRINNKKISKNYRKRQYKHEAEKSFIQTPNRTRTDLFRNKIFSYSNKLPRDDDTHIVNRSGNKIEVKIGCIHIVSQ